MHTVLLLVHVQKICAPEQPLGGHAREGGRLRVRWSPGAQAGTAQLDVRGPVRTLSRTKCGRGRRTAPFGGELTARPRVVRRLVEVAERLELDDPACRPPR